MSNYGGQSYGRIGRSKFSHPVPESDDMGAWYNPLTWGKEVADEAGEAVAEVVETAQGTEPLRDLENLGYDKTYGVGDRARRAWEIAKKNAVWSIVGLTVGGYVIYTATKWAKR